MRRRYPEHTTAMVALALFVLALFYRLLFTDRVLANGDILHYFYPYRDYAAAALREGRIPLWNPFLFLGVPFLANPQAAVLYPLHWPLSWLPVTQQIYGSGALHAWILGLGGYTLLRRWGYGLAAGLISGLVLAGSGFYGGLLGHINQMNGAAWLPWAVVVLEMTETGKRERASGQADRRSLLPTPYSLLLPTALFALLVALMLLAGHTQTAFINLFGVGVWGLASGNGPPTAIGKWRIATGNWRAALAPLLVVGLGTGLGVLMSAAQILPTLELSELGLRSGGLSYQDATSFSLPPLKLAWTLLPSYGLADLSAVFGTLGYSEFVAYVGLVGLGLAVLGGWRGRGKGRRFGLLMVGLGLFLALGRWNPFYYPLYWLVPGFDLFRTPARWMMLYTVGMAVLAGVGIGHWRSAIGDRRLGKISGRAANLQVPIAALLALDLLLAARSLPHTQSTAPQAVHDVRTAPAHLLTDPVRQTLGPAAAGRFLSMSTITFDPGDMVDWRRHLVESNPPQLDAQAFQELVVALKSQEILAPNLPLLWRIPAVDGFDGGVLPLQRYLRFLTLLVPEDDLVPDGRLREQIKKIPPTGLLNLLHVQYVITDKVKDLWFQDVYYDRQIGAHLQPGALDQVEMEAHHSLEATQIGILGTASGPDDGPERWRTEVQPVAEVDVYRDGEVVDTLTITAGGAQGAHFADPHLGSTLAEGSGAVVAYRDVEEGSQEYLALLPLARPVQPDRLAIRLLDPALAVTIQAVTLIDGRTGMFVPLLPSDRGRLRLVHSGDVKIYENLDLAPRARLVYSTVPVGSIDEALDWLAGHGDQPGTAVVEGTVRLVGHPEGTQGEATLLAYTAEQIEVGVESTAPALLLLSDSYYPGWRASVDGVPVDILPANGLFRGVSVPAGTHTVTFRFQPQSWRRGLWLSGAGLIVWMGLLAGAWRRRPLRADDIGSGV